MHRERDFYVNGIDGETGQYLYAPGAVEDIAAAVDGTKDARLAAEALKREKGVLGLPHGMSELDVSSARWAVVAPEEEQAMLCKALAPLVAHRRRQLGNDAVTCLTYGGESRPKWLARYGAANSNVDPAKVPYYLLIAGSSAKIPFRFVHDLAVDYAVGRLDFDSPADYRVYAERLVATETSPPKRRRGVRFFAPCHEFDPPTQLSSTRLVAPLAERFGSLATIGVGATKSRFSELVRGRNDERAAVLFTASHGVGFGCGDPHQKQRQGAVLCQDWPRLGVIDESHYFAAADVPSDADVDGMMAFHFACYSAGTPQSDRFFKRTAQAAKQISPEPFVAALPKELLRRGALAVVGHVDRAWGFSIVAPGAGTQIQHFENFLASVLDGEPVGHAMRGFAEMYASVSVELSGEIERSEDEDVPPEILASLWTQRNDAQAYIVIGDPAARLQFDEQASNP